MAIFLFITFTPTTIIGVVQPYLMQLVGLYCFIPTTIVGVVQRAIHMGYGSTGFIPTTIVGVVQPQKVGLPSGKVVF